MRSSTAYFAGAGTVIAAIAVGLGGGYLFFNIVSPHPEKHGSSEVTRLERRMSPEPIPATNKGAPEPVPYLAAPQVSAAVGDPPAQPQQAPQQPQPQQTTQSQPQQAQPQQQQATQQPQPQQTPPPQTQPQQSPSQQASTKPAAAAPPAPPAAPAAQPVAAAEQPAAREKSQPEESWARARDADVRRDGRRDERRKAERDRRQQWSERRKWRQRDDDGELIEVERKVREETEPRRIREDSEPRQFFASEPARIEMPRVRLFDMD
jgi:outer membrane biosynthesis protein TonB